MVIKVTLKDPDTLYDAVLDAVAEKLKQMGLSHKERELIAESRAEEQQDIIVRRWMKNGEYLTVEFDTITMTATVVPNA